MTPFSFTCAHFQGKFSWASGVIEEVKTRRNTALGSFDMTSYRVTYTDNFGFPKTDELGEWRTLNQWDASTISFDGRKRVDSSRPPLEALDLVLTLCDKKTLCQQIERAIQIHRDQIGDIAFARTILSHAQKQKNAGLPFYETYYQTLVGDPNASPPREGYLQKAELTEALQNLDSPDANYAAPGEKTEMTVTAVNSPLAMPPGPIMPPALPSAASPPSMASHTQWFYAVGGQQRGPVGIETLRELVANGLITAQTNVWCQGMTTWEPASETELKTLFGIHSARAFIPPPLPSP
jgi:hypothetical protein